MVLVENLTRMLLPVFYFAADNELTVDPLNAHAIQLTISLFQTIVYLKYYHSKQNKHKRNTIRNRPPPLERLVLTSAPSSWAPNDLLGFPPYSYFRTLQGNL